MIKLAKYLLMGLITGLVLAVYLDCFAGIVSKPYTFTDGTVASASQVNSDFDTLYTLVNGSIDNANISGSAAIVFSKLDSATVAGVSATQTLTNKTLTSPILNSAVLTTPQINDTSADHQYVFAVNELLADRTVTMPLLTGNDTFVFNDFAATLTNKTLTSPAISAPTLSGTATGTYTLGGTPTITSPAISSPTISGTPTAAGATWTDLGIVTTADINGGNWTGTIDGTPTAATATWTSLGTVTTADINGGTIDGTAIGANSASTGVFTTARVTTSLNAPMLVPGQVQNLSWTKAAGVITIAGADGTALSASNPAWVCVPSAVTAGTFVTLPVTANITFNDDDHASSHLAGWTFGVTTGVAWNTEMPIFHYFLNKDDTAAGLVFGFSRSPIRTFMATALIGDKDAAPATPSENNMFVAASITEADYNLKPCILVGASYMKKVAAADDWTLYQGTAVYDMLGFGNQTIDYITASSWAMPPGQNGANATTRYFATNDPTWATPANIVAQYTLSRDGTVRYVVDTSSAGNCTNGTNAGTIKAYLPLSATKFSHGTSAVTYGAAAYTTATAIVDKGSPTYAFFLSTTTLLVGNGFSNAGDDVYLDITYKAF